MTDTMPPDGDAGLAHLDELVRRIAEAETDEHEIPPEVLGAYVTDRATPEQVQQVHAALDRSNQLREELVYIARLFSRDLQEQYDLAIVPRPGVRPAPEDPEAQLNTEPPVRPDAPRWWEFRRAQVVMGLAASLVVVFLLVRIASETQSPKSSSWSQLAVLEPSQLREIVLRDGEPPAPIDAQNEAAVVRARIRAALSRGEVRDSLTASRPEATAVRLRKQGRVITYAGAIPVGSQPKALWVLALPSRRLLRADFPSGHGVVGWPDATESDGLVILSWQLEGRFGASGLAADMK